MSNSTYNGWTNYATWRVNLEIFDGMNLEDLTGRTDWEAYDLGNYLKDWAEEIMENDSPNGGLARDYAMAFLSDVNWMEIAKHMINDYAEENA
jgi:hypothetical protein